MRTVREHNAAWRSWFDRQGVQPEDVTYEEAVADPRATVERIARRLQVAVPAEWRPRSPHRKQADPLNHQWAAALRAAVAADGDC